MIKGPPVQPMEDISMRIYLFEGLLGRCCSLDFRFLCKLALQTILCFWSFMSTETAVSFEFKLFCFADIVYFDWYIFVYMYFFKGFSKLPRLYTYYLYICKWTRCLEYFSNHCSGQQLKSVMVEYVFPESWIVFKTQNTWRINVVLSTQTPGPLSVLVCEIVWCKLEALKRCVKNHALY